jgi:hypothetical protein
MLSNNYQKVYIETFILLFPQTTDMKNLSANKTPQATYGGDDIGGSVVRGMLGALLFKKS